MPGTSMPAGQSLREVATPRDTQISPFALPPAAAARVEDRSACGGRAPQAPAALGNPGTGLHPRRLIKADLRGRRGARRETPAQRDERRSAERVARAKRYRRRDTLRPLAALTRCRSCGSTAVGDGGVTVGVKTYADGTTHAGYGGIATCGSVWSCPQCAAVVATRRADELADVMRAVDELGGSAHLLTLTMQHTARDRLGWDRSQRRRFAGLERRRRARDLALEVGDPVDEDQARADETERAALMQDRGCWDAVSDGWAAVTSGKRWTKDQRRHGGFLGWAKVVEVTHGRSGWHVHVHALLCFAGDASDAEVRPMAQAMFERWQRKLQAQGFDASGDMAQDGKVPGWDLRRAQLGDADLAHYFTKIAHEITSGHRKEGRRPGGATPFALGAAAVETYTEHDVARWWEWQHASDGRRQLTWSGGDKNLRTLAQLGREQTDEEIAEETVEADERLGLSPEVWGWVRASDHVTDVIDIAETHGLAGLAAWLDSHGQGVVRGAGLDWVERPEVSPDQPIPRDQGLGRGHRTGPAAVLRGHDVSGRPRRRPSDRPPRWTDDARAVLT